MATHANSPALSQPARAMSYGLGALALVAGILAVAVSPALGVGLAAATAALPSAWAARRRLAPLAAGIVVGLLALVTAVSPPTAAVVAGGFVVLAAAWAARRPLGLAIAAGLAAVAAIAAILVVAVRPVLAVVAAGAAAAGAAGWRVRAPVRAAGVAVAVAIGWALAAVAVLALACGLALAVAAWPVTVGLGAVVAAILLLAWRAPAWGLAAGILLIGFEGSVKILLGLEPTPLPFDNRAVGAAAIDLALFGAIGSVLVADRLRTPRAIWAQVSRWERIVLGALVAWLVLSVLQIAQGGDLQRGVEGLRIFQAYAAVALAATCVAGAGRVSHVVLAIGGVVALYAAVRVGIGPAVAEERFALSVQTTTMYGTAVRAVGSFSSAVGLTSYLTPLAVFGLVIGFFEPRVRWWAWGVAAACVIGILGSYGRAPLLGIVLGLAFALAVVAASRDLTRRRKLTAVGLVVCSLGLTYVGVHVASQASPALRERAEGVLNPLSDESVQMRFDTWRDAASEALRRPQGRGVGAVGSASAVERRQLVTTDNSFLKVLLEQGVAGLLLFLAGTVGAAILLARRLNRVPAGRRIVGLAALAGFVAFLGVSATGEYVEQPGKVVAWALLGIAAAQAFPRGRAGES